MQIGDDSSQQSYKDSKRIENFKNFDNRENSKEHYKEKNYLEKNYNNKEQVSNKKNISFKNNDNENPKTLDSYENSNSFLNNSRDESTITLNPYKMNLDKNIEEKNKKRQSIDKSLNYNKNKIVDTKEFEYIQKNHKDVNDISFENDNEKEENIFGQVQGYKKEFDDWKKSKYTEINSNNQIFDYNLNNKIKKTENILSVNEKNIMNTNNLHNDNNINYSNISPLGVQVIVEI